MRFSYSTFLLLFGLISCRSSADLNSTEKILDLALTFHGAAAYEGKEIEFDFRGKHFTSMTNQGRFRYTMGYSDSTGDNIRELSNDGFTFVRNGKAVEATEIKMKAYANSVNSVIYFSQLPYRLKDPAVILKLRPEESLDELQYYVLEARFREENGGEDFDDVFLYWIEKETGRMDFLAYSYATDGGGLRFRKAFNTRRIKGIVFQDFENYSGDHKSQTLYDLSEAYKKGRLKLLSEIQLENIEVKNPG